MLEGNAVTPLMLKKHPNIVINIEQLTRFTLPRDILSEILIQRLANYTMKLFKVNVYFTISIIKWSFIPHLDC